MENKKRRSVISLATKLEILNRLNGGAGSSHVGRIFGLQESTIRSIKKNEKAIRESAKLSTNESVKKLFKVRNSVLEDTERQLADYMRNEKDGQKATKVQICEMAAKIYDEKLAAQSIGKKSLAPKANKFSTGWFHGFLKRHSLRKYTTDASAEMHASKDASIKEEKFKTQPKMDFDENFIDIGDEDQLDLKDEDDNVKVFVIEEETTSFCTNYNSEPRNRKRPASKRNSKPMDARHVSKEPEMDKDEDDDVDEEEEDDDEDEETLTIEKIKKGLDIGLQLEKHFIINDPDIVRVKQFLKDIKKCMAPYEKLLK